MKITQNMIRFLSNPLVLQVLPWFSALILVLLVALPRICFAQEVTGNILGSVTDSSGAAVASAKVTITNTDRDAVERTVSTDALGEFSAPLLPIGKYSVKVEAPGFRKYAKSDIVLSVNDRLNQQIVLQVGSITQTVAVQANALQIDTQSPTAGELISGVAVTQLPLQTRNYAGLIELEPGASSSAGVDAYIGAVVPSGAGYISPSLNGSIPTQNNWTVDGVDNVDRGGNASNLDYPSVDAIAQVSVLRGNYSAEYGRSAGGEINVITRSGTSKFHGDLYEFFRNNILDANTWSDKHFSGPAVPLPPFRYNDFGGTFGGPIFIPGVYNVARDRTFFFYSQEVRRIVQSLPAVSLVPNEAERGLDPATGNNPTFPYPICLGPVNGPGTCPAGESSTTIPSTMVNPAAAAYLKDVYSAVPLPQNTNSDQLASNEAGVFNANQEIIRVDHTFNKTISGFFRFLNDAIPTVSGGGIYGGSSVPNVAASTTQNPGRNIAASLNFVFSPTFLNQLTYGYSYDGLYSANTNQFAASHSTDVVAAVKLPFPETLNRIPSIGFGAYLGSMYGFGVYADSNKNQMIIDNLTKIVGRHSLQFGLTYSHYEKSENSAGNNAGTFNFTSSPDATLSNGADPSAEWHQEFAYFLLGQSSEFSQLTQDLRAYIFQNEFEFYGQDQFRLRPNITLSYGVRYSNFRQPTDGNGRATSFVPSLYNSADAPVIDNQGNLCTPQFLPCAGTSSTNLNYNPLNGIIIGGKTSRFGSAIAPQSDFGIQPRVGFAFDPGGNGKMSIRGGYGLFVESTAAGFVEEDVFANVPFVQNDTIFNAPFNNPAAGLAANNSVPFLTVTDPNWRQPYVQQWNIDIQRQLPSDVIADVGYYGSMGTHLPGAVDVNEPIPGSYHTNPLIQNNPNFIAEGNSQIDGNTENLLNLIRPYTGYGVIDMFKTVFKSNYHSLQASLKKQFSTGSLINVDYTWSRGLTNAPAYVSSQEPQNSYDLQAEYGPSLTQPQVLNIDFVYLVPYFAKQSGWTGHALGGWELSGIVSAVSGSYQSPSTTDFNDPGGIGAFVSSNAGKSIRPDQISNPNERAPHTAAEWFNVNGLQNVPTTEFRVGDARAYSIRGPGTEEFDVAAMKNFKVTEGSKVQFRVEGYNAINHTNYSYVDSDLGDGSTGLVLGASQNRILQLGLKYIF